MSIRSHLISQHKNKLISNSGQSLNATDLLPITFGVILPPKLCGKNSTNSQINPELWMRIRILKYVLSKNY